MTQYIPGDVQIKTVSLYASAVINITELVRFMSIYESIITPGIIVEMRIDDTRNLLSSLPILGGEKITIEVQTPGRNIRQINGVIATVVDSTPTDNMRAKSYTIEVVSEEIIIDKATQVCKSYNTNISSIVEDVVKYYLKTTKNVSVQQTRGIQKIILPSITPFKSIDMLRNRSISVEDKSSMYVFFENNTGFHYKTIEKLMTEGDVGDRIFSNDETIRGDISQSGFRNIISYDQPNQFDLNSRVKSGGISHEVTKFDIKTLSYTKTQTKFNASDYKSADGAMKSVDDSRTMAKYGKDTGSTSWITHDSGMPDTFISDGLGARKNIANLMSQGSIHLHVFGDSELSAGQLIDLNILDNITGSMNPSLHPQLSGKYIISFIRHIIRAEGSNPRYTCSIEAIKGGYKREA